METSLHFVITTVEGNLLTQDIKCPSDAAEAAVNQMMAQYASVGMLKKEGNKYSLLPSNQISFVEIELSPLVVASPSETARVAAAAGGIKKIITKT
jgi:hypothetical protein